MEADGVGVEVSEEGGADVCSVLDVGFRAGLRRGEGVDRSGCEGGLSAVKPINQSRVSRG